MPTRARQSKGGVQQSSPGSAVAGSRGAIVPPREQYARLKKLTPLLERFCVEFCVDPYDATAAWVRAHNGVRPKGAKTSASAAMCSPLVLGRIKEIRAAALAKAGISVEKTELEIARLAYVDVGQLFGPNNCLKAIADMPEDARRAVVSVEVDEIFEHSDDVDDLKRLADVEQIIAALLGSLPKGSIEQLPAALGPHVRELQRWAKPPKSGAKQRHLLGYTRKVKLADKKGALELAGKRDRLFVERVEHSVDATLEQILAGSYQDPAAVGAKI